MPNYELKRLDECFERLMHLQNEISCRAVRVQPTSCSDDELHKTIVYVQLAGELREVVLRYRPDIEELNNQKEPGLVSKCVGWACAQFKGGA